MRSRVLVGVLAVFGLVIGIVGATPPPAAQALSPGLMFSSDALPTWQTNGQVWALAHSQGRVVVGGSFTQIRPGAGQSGTAQTVRGLAILNAATGAPDSCQLPAGYGAGTPTIYAAQAAPDGNSIFVAGNFSSIGGVTVSRLAEIDVVNCTVLPFRAGTISSFVLSLAVTDSAVYFGGYFQTVAGQQRRSFAKVDRNGQLQPWVANASGTTVDKYTSTILPDASSRGTAVVVSPDETKVAVGGDFFTMNGTNTHSIAVVDATTGSLLRAYPGLVQNTSRTQALRTDGTNFYAGNEGSAAFDGKFAVSWDTLDEVWRDVCLGATQAVLVHEGLLFSGHHHHDCAAQGMFPDGRRVYLTVAEAHDPTQRQLGWAPELNNGTGEGLGPRALVVGSAGGKDYLWVGGEFTRVNGQLQQAITRFGPDDTGAPATPSLAVRAITPGQIQVNIRSVVDPDDSHITYAVYRGTNTTTPVWTGVATSQWWYRSQVTFVDNDVVPGTNYTYRVRAIDGAGNQSGLSAAQNVVASATASPYAAAVIADSPRLYWRYDDISGSNWVIDSAGQTVSGMNGIAQGPVTRTAAGAIPGDNSRSATFVEGTADGPLSYVWNDQIAYGPTEYSIETWFRTSSTTGGALVSYGNGRPRSDNGSDVISNRYTVGGTPLGSVTNTFDRTLYMESGTGRLRFAVRAPSTVQSLQSPAAYNDNQWHHVVATQGPAGMRLYVDGIPVAQNNVTQNREYYGSWRVGGDNLNGFPNSGGNNNWAGRFFDGQIDETAVYYHPLTHQQAVAHYTAGGGTPDLNPAPTDAYGAAVFADGAEQYWRFDESGGTVAQDSAIVGARSGTLGSSVARTNGSPIASGRYVTTPGTNTNGSGIVTHGSQTAAPSSWSAELWFQTTSTSGGKLIGFENSQNGNGTNTGTDKHIYMSTNGRLHVGVFSSNQNRVASTTEAYNDGLWHHVVATQGADGLRLYVDGQQVASTTYTTSRTSTGWWRVGGGYLTGWANAPAGNVSNHYFAGAIDEVAVYSTALSAATVSAHYGIGVQDSTAPTVPGSVTGSFDGAAQIAWQASTDNVSVAGYQVHRGATADFAPSADTLRGTLTGTSFSEPLGEPGAYYYRVIAFDGAGNESAASTAAVVEVPDTTPPTAPTGVAASQIGADVAVTWTSSTDDVGVTGYAVHRGGTAGFTPSADTLLADGVTGTSYTDAAVDEGTWHYRVIAFDAATNASDASSAASIEVTAPDVTAPTVPGALAATLNGADVQLGWSASTDAVGVTGYSIYRGTTAGFTAGAASKIGESSGTAYTDSDRPAGTWFYRVTAHDAAGNTSVSTSAVSVTVVAPVEPVTITVIPTEDAMAVESAPNALYGSTNTLSARLGGGTLESFIKVDVPAAPAGTQLTDVKLNVRTTTEPTAHSSDAHEVRIVSGPWEESTITWNNRPTGSPSAVLGSLTGATALNSPYVVSLDPAVMTTVLGTTATLRLTATGGDNVRLWSAESTPASYRPSVIFTFTPVTQPVEDTEAPSVPGTPTAAVTGNSVALSWGASTDNVGVTRYLVHRGESPGFAVNAGSLAHDVDATTWTDLGLAPGTYYYRIVATDAAGNTSAASAVVSATVESESPPTDTEAPSVPGTPAATVTGTTANLSWTASTDNVAVTGYTVHRGNSAGFTANVASQIAAVSGTSYADTGLAQGTYFYKIVAVDGAGNASAASGAGSATVAAPAGPPITQTIVTSADTMAAAINASFAYGTSNQLSARGDTAIESFLAFELPAAPAGYVLTDASLVVRTSNDPTAHSTDTHQLHLVDAAWDEATLTWNNRPTSVASGVIGELSGATALNTMYTVVLSTADLAPRAGTTVTLRLSSAGTDNLRVSSRESAAANRPTLTLTYTPAP